MQTEWVPRYQPIIVGNEKNGGVLTTAFRMHASIPLNLPYSFILYPILNLQNMIPCPGLFMDSAKRIQCYGYMHSPISASSIVSILKHETLK